MGIKKKKTTKAKAPKSGGGLVASGLSAGKTILGMGSKSGGGGHRRSKGPAYWTNKVIVEKLKRKYQKLKYGSVR